MAADSNYTLRIPSSLMDDLRIAAIRDGVSMNSFVVQAVAEKMAALRADGMLPELTAAEQSAYLGARAARAGDSGLAEILGKVGTTTDVLPGDEVPGGWFDRPKSTDVPVDTQP